LGRRRKGWLGMTTVLTCSLCFLMWAIPAFCILVFLMGASRKKTAIDYARDNCTGIIEDTVTSGCPVIKE
jgi:hypothetical protein